MSSDLAVRARNLGKNYQIYSSPGRRLLGMLIPNGERFAKSHWAVRGVDLDIRRGETFGILGRNGAGKSTLLQLICGVLRPSEGVVEINGRVTALLELGAGLNPEFDGRTNIRMLASILGVSDAEVNEKFEEILDFAELGDFIDQPVKLYSSGMVMRLAFSAAINFDPAILIIDEALAVGDELFQHKCMRRIERIKEDGATILFVSHSANTVRQICDRGLVLDGGQVATIGTAKDAVESYLNLLYGFAPSADTNSDTTSSSDPSPITESGLDPEGKVVALLDDEANDEPEIESIRQNPNEISGEKHAHLESISVMGRNNWAALNYSVGEIAKFRSKVRFTKRAEDVIAGMMITTPAGVDCYHTNTMCKGDVLPVVEAGDVYEFTFELPIQLCAGSYIVVFDCQHNVLGKAELCDIFYEALHFSVPPEKPVEDGGIAALDAEISFRKVESPTEQNEKVA